MWKRILQIDYEALADHVLTRYVDNDDPRQMTFEGIRDVLKKHIDTMMSEVVNMPDADEELTGILFEHYIGGVVMSTMVTSNPGVVVRRGEHSLMLPLVIIELTV
jgi:hypothetical protein